MLFMEIHPYLSKQLAVLTDPNLSLWQQLSYLLGVIVSVPAGSYLRMFFCYMALQSFIFLFFACKCSSITSQKNRWLMCSPHIFILISFCMYLFQTVNIILTGNKRWKVCDRWSSPMPLYSKPVLPVSKVFPMYLFNPLFNISCDGDIRHP